MVWQWAVNLGALYSEVGQFLRDLRWEPDQEGGISQHDPLQIGQGPYLCREVSNQIHISYLQDPQLSQLGERRRDRAVDGRFGFGLPKRPATHGMS